MADTVLKTSSDPFLSQAQLHRNFAEHTRQMLGKHQVLHNNLIEAMQSSSMSSSLQPYLEWWDSMQTSLTKHADLHEQMADHLEKTVSSFDETDDTISGAFSS